MKRWLTWCLCALAGMSGLAGCGDACDDLEERCEGCEPPEAVQCGLVVAQEDADACQLLLDDPDFQSGCP